MELNAGYGYELLSDATATDYIHKFFPADADLLNTWAKVDDYILRADLIRYIALLGDGGIYSDMDTDCTRPIADWLSPDLEEAADVVVGIEWDQRAEHAHKDRADAAQFCSWTIMAKPGSKHMRHVVDVTLEKLRGAEHEGSIRAANESEVLRLTGPRASFLLFVVSRTSLVLTCWSQGFTDALFRSMSLETGDPITATNISGLTSPKLFGSVLVMPISSFASGQDHEGSMAWGNEQQLLSHHWSGFHTWKVDYQS